MSESKKVQLESIRGGAGIHFLEAELSEKYDIPFAIIWYSFQGIKQPEGLRLDLDKELFLDNPFDDIEKKKVLHKAAREITDFLVDHSDPEIKTSHA